MSDTLQLGKRAFSEVYPGWPGSRVVANLDAGLIRVDDVKGWTAQVYGVGQVGDVVDLNVGTFRLDIIDQPLIALGATSGLMKGKILGLFYRYKTVGGLEYVSDFVIGPRDGDTPLNNYPGDPARCGSRRRPGCAAECGRCPHPLRLGAGMGRPGIGRIGRQCPDAGRARDLHGDAVP